VLETVSVPPEEALSAVKVDRSRVVPLPTERSPLIAKLATKVVDAVPLRVKLPLMVVVLACSVLAPLVLRVKL